jgi:hypothetical protein
MTDDNDDEKSTASLNNIESKEDGEIDLSAFNFQDMDDLKIDSEDDMDSPLAATSPSEGTAWMSNYAM